MKRVTIIVVSIVIILLLSAFTIEETFPRSFHFLISSNTDLGKENVDGLTLQNEVHSENIFKKYGKITEQSRDVEGYDYFKLTDGIEIAVNKNGNITRFIVTDRNLETARGIRIGDSKKDIIKTYGENYYTRTEQGTNIIGYVDKKRNITLEFWLSDNKVNFYRLDYKSME